MTRREMFVVLTAVALAPVLKVFEFVALPVVHRPDFLVVLSVVCGWACDVWVAAPAGFIVGFVEDLLVGRAPGSRSVSLMVAAVAASLLKRVINPESLLSKFIAALSSAFVADAVNYAVLRSMGVALSLNYFARHILPATIVWAGALVLPVDFIIVRISHSLARLWPAKRGRDREATA